MLSDPRLRDLYDKYGEEGVAPEGGFQNPTAFFNSMFGGGRFEDLIGEVSFGTTLDQSISPEVKDQMLVSVAFHSKLL